MLMTATATIEIAAAKIVVMSKHTPIAFGRFFECKYTIKILNRQIFDKKSAIKPHKSPFYDFPELFFGADAGIINEFTL